LEALRSGKRIDENPNFSNSFFSWNSQKQVAAADQRKSQSDELRLEQFFRDGAKVILCLKSREDKLRRSSIAKRFLFRWRQPKVAQSLNMATGLRGMIAGTIAKA